MVNNAQRARKCYFLVLYNGRAGAINMRYIVTGTVEPSLNTILAHSEIYIVCGDDKGV